MIVNRMFLLWPATTLVQAGVQRLQNEVPLTAITLDIINNNDYEAA